MMSTVKALVKYYSISCIIDYRATMKNHVIKV